MSECELSNLIAELERAVSDEWDKIYSPGGSDYEGNIAEEGAALALGAVLSAIRTVKTALKAREAGQ